MELLALDSAKKFGAWYGTERFAQGYDVRMAAQGLNVSGVGQLLDTLPLAQRLLRYRQLSQEALRKATQAEDEEMRAGYLSMAAGWHMLATEIERLRDRQPAAIGDLPPGAGVGADGADSSISRVPPGPVAQ